MNWTEVSRCPHGNGLNLAAPFGTQIERITFRFPCGCGMTASGTLARAEPPPVPSPFMRTVKRVDWKPA